MMTQWRITKYDPKLRDSKGAFTGDDWVMVQEIGLEFNGKRLTREAYLDMENRYVESALACLKFAGVKSLRIKNLQIYPADSFITEHDLGIDFSAEEGQELMPAEITTVLRTMFRDIAWCELTSDGFYLHIGWDYYMYIGGNEEMQVAKPEIEKMGLFVEDCISPLLEDN